MRLVGLLRAGLSACLIFFMVSCGPKEKGFEDIRAEGLAFVVSGEDAKALEILSQALLLNPADRQTLYFLGIVYGNLGETDSAVSYLRKVVKLYGVDEETCRNLYTVAIAAERWDAALEALRQLEETGVSHATLLERYYAAYMGARFYAPAADIIDQMIKINPERGELYLRSANVNGLLGNFAKGEMAAQEALRRFGPSVEAYGNLGVLHMRQKNYNKAELFFRKALALDSARDASWLNLGNLLSTKPDAASKREALRVLGRVNTLVAHQFRLDTVLTRLRAELGDK